jgi:hypothetical protein
MMRSIAKSAAAAFILGCGVAGLCLPAVAEEPAGWPVPEVHPLSLGPVEAVHWIRFPRNGVLLPPALPPPSPALPPSSEKERQILNRIRADWQARHKRIRSLSVAWDFRSAFRKGRNSDPPHNNSEVSHNELWLDDGFRGRLLVAPHPNAKPRLFTFDGMTARSSNPETHGGEIWSGAPGRGLAAPDTIIWCVAVDPLCVDLLRGKFADPSCVGVHVLGENAIIGDRHCVKLRISLTSRPDESGLLDTLWIDPSRDSVIVGWERAGPSTPDTFLSIEYVLDKQHGWLPSRWRLTTAGPAGESTATATRIAINEQYPASLFRQTFAPGTLVRDPNLSQWYVIANDGSKTPVGEPHPPKPEPIDAALNRTTDFVINPEPLKDALDFIAQRYHIKTAFDDGAVRQGLIDPAAQVQTQKHGIKLKELLDVLLKQSPKPLRYEIREDVITLIADVHSGGKPRSGP